MSVKASISITDQQDAFARKLVEEGHYESLSDVVQHGLELVRQETEWFVDDHEALVALLNERMDGEFIAIEESERQINAMIAGATLSLFLTTSFDRMSRSVKLKPRLSSVRGGELNSSDPI